jgi:hypothetical protein
VQWPGSSQVVDDRTRIGAAIARQSQRLHLGQHLGSRIWQMMSPLGAAQTAGRRALALGFGAADVVTSRWLLQAPRRHRGVQAAIDLLDTAVWSSLAADEPESSRCAIIPGAALCAELGAEQQLRALALPLAHAAIAGVVRKRRGHTLRLGQIGWQVWGIMGSVLLADIGRRRRRKEMARHLEALRPSLVAAELAGMNDVGIVADDLLDSVQRASTLIELSLGARGGFIGDLDAGAIKQSMADMTRASGAYLSDAVAQWQALHNTVAVDLRSVVRIEVPVRHRTDVLSAHQVANLNRFLDEVDPRGQVTLAVEPDRITLAGRSLPMVMMAPPAMLYFDPLPVGLLMTAAWMAAPTGAVREHLRWSSAGLPVAIAAGGAALALKQSSDRSHAGHANPSMALGAAGTALALYSFLAPKGVRRPFTPEGVSRFPFTQALQGFLMIVELTRTTTSSRQRGGLVAVAIGSLGVGLARTSRPRSVRHLLAELVWPLTTASSSAALANAISADSAAIQAEVQSGDQQLLEDARRAGRQRMLDLVELSIERAAALLAGNRSKLDGRVAEETQRRIEFAASGLATAQGSGTAAPSTASTSPGSGG